MSPIRWLRPTQWCFVDPLAWGILAIEYIWVINVGDCIDFRTVEYVLLLSCLNRSGRGDSENLYMSSKLDIPKLPLIKNERYKEPLLASICSKHDIFEVMASTKGASGSRAVTDFRISLNNDCKTSVFVWFFVCVIDPGLKAMGMTKAVCSILH